MIYVFMLFILLRYFLVSDQNQILGGVIKRRYTFNMYIWGGTQKFPEAINSTGVGLGIGTEREKIHHRGRNSGGIAGGLGHSDKRQLKEMFPGMEGALGRVYHIWRRELWRGLERFINIFFNNSRNFWVSPLMCPPNKGACMESTCGSENRQKPDELFCGNLRLPGINFP